MRSLQVGLKPQQLLQRSPSLILSCLSYQTAGLTEKKATLSLLSARQIVHTEEFQNEARD